MSKTSVVKGILLGISALMVWETLSASTFGMIFKPPVKGAIELLYFAALLGSVVFVAIAAYRLVCRRGTVRYNVLTLLFSLCWCLVLVSCLILMAALTAI